MRRRRPRKETSTRVHLASLGCAKNLVDSETLLARLGLAGALVGAPADEADVLIVNTCGFIEPAKQESLEVIRRYVKVKADDPTKRLLVIGCLVERARDELEKRLPEVDGFFGLGEQSQIVAACGLAAPPEADVARLLLTPPHTAFLRISEGCDNACTYCTIPRIRGPFRSRRPEEILREARDLASSGVRELNLIGQDTTSYGRDLPERVGVAHLLRKVAEIEGIRWVRLLYAHPAHVTEDLIQTFAEVPELCPYIDLPLQHLDDEILRRMGRGVTQREILDLIDRFRRRVPDVAIRTTFIVGFPGETPAKFDALLRLVEDLRFDHLGAFAYSREDGTPAASFSGQVDESEKLHRVRELMLVQRDVVASVNGERIGRIEEVVVDRLGDDPEGSSIGRTKRQAPDVDGRTLFREAGLAPGRFVTAKIVEADGYDLVGERLD